MMTMRAMGVMAVIMCVCVLRADPVAWQTSMLIIANMLMQLLKAVGVC